MLYQFSRAACGEKNPFPLDRLTRVGKYVVSYEYRSTDPLSLRERVGVRVKCLPISALDGGRLGWG